MAKASHDTLFKSTFSKTENVISELRAVLPPQLLSKIDLTTLSPEPELTVGEDLSSRFCDVLYSADIAGTRGFVYVLLEHQSSVDRLMPFRVLEYVVRILSRYIEQRRSEKKSIFPLPVVLPIVVHHSESGWTASTEVRELFSEEMQADPFLRDYIPRLKFILDDISRATDEELLNRARHEASKVLSLALWAMRDSRNAKKIMKSLEVWGDVMTELSASESNRDALFAIISYLATAGAELSQLQLEKIVEYAAPEAKDVLMTLAEQWRKEGIQKGQRGLLTKQLFLKFGDISESMNTKLNSASEQDLNLWGERILTANTLDEVFH